MHSDDVSHPSRRSILGVAGATLATPLLGARSTLPPVSRLDTLAASSTASGEQAVGAQRGGHAGAGDTRPLDARAIGVVGDGRADDTRAVQALLDQCAAEGGRIARFGTMTVRITGPLKSRSVGIVFDPASYGGASAPGFVVSGSNYTALTVVGSVADFCVTLTGDDGVDIADSGTIAGDRRPRIDGIAFGTDDEPFALSTVRSVRVNNLAGCGVRHAQCWDSTFLSVSVERCGRDDRYAFEIAGDARRSCNETTWARIHVEQAIGGSIRIDPGTLSCSFVKIHSERSIARPSLPTWLLAGSCVYDSVRLTATDPKVATVAVVGNQTELRNLRAEGGIRVTVDASGGTINFHNPGAVLQPAPNQNGIVNIIGGVVSVLALGGGWNLIGADVDQLEVGFMSPGHSARLTGCTVNVLRPQAGSQHGEVILSGTRVAAGSITGAGRLRGLHLRDNSSLAAKDGSLACTEQLVVIDPSSQIQGDVVLQRTSLRLAGSITGNLTVRGPVHDARADDGAWVGGTVEGWGPPSIAAKPGAWSVNLATAGDRQPKGAREAVAGWRFLADGWRAIRVKIEG